MLQKKMFKKKLGILKQYVKNGWGVKLNKDNSAYHVSVQCYKNG